MRRLLRVALLALTLSAASCDGTTVTFAPSQGALTAFVDISGACAISQAWGGSPAANPVPALTPCALAGQSYTSLENGSLVTTSSCGQAWLKIAGCGTLYVFHNSEFVASFCKPDAQVAGCVTTGTAAWRGSCANAVGIGTPSSSILLEGTWASLTYVEERQLSLVVMFDGSADATPFIDADGTKLGDPTKLNASQFWFTAPGEVAQVVGGLDGRVAQPLEQLPAVVHELGLESWFAEVFARAAADGFDASQVAPLPVLQVRLAGGQLEDVAVREAVLTSYDWKDRADTLLPNGDEATLVGLAGDAPPIDLRTHPFDQAFAKNAFGDTGSFGVDVIWVKGDLEPFATSLWDSLLAVGLDARATPVGDDDAASEAFEAAIRSEGAAIWLSDH